MNTAGSEGVTNPLAGIESKARSFRRESLEVEKVEVQKERASQERSNLGGVLIIHV